MKQKTHSVSLLLKDRRAVPLVHQFPCVDMVIYLLYNV